MTVSNPHLRVGAAMMAGMLGTAIISPLYPIYKSEWSLSSGQVTQVYVIYMMGALLALLFLGRLPDRLGAMRVLRASLTLCLLGAVLTCLSQNFLTLAIARFTVGVAASLVTASGTVVLTRVIPEHVRPHLAVIASVIVSLGFGLGPLLGGIFGEWAPYPLITTQIPAIAALIGGLAIAFYGLPGETTQPQGLKMGDLVPRLSWPERKYTLHFSLACCIPFIAFGVFGIYASLAPLLIKELLGFGGPLVSGLYIATYLLGTALTQTLARGLSPRRGGLIALALIAVGNLAMLTNIEIHSIWLLVGGVLIAAIAHGLGLLASTAVLIAASNPTNRGALTASYWVIGYSGGIFPLLITGWISDHSGMDFAIKAFCTFAILLCAITWGLIMMFTQPRRKAIAI